MKMKWFVWMTLFLALAACAPTAVSPQTETASRPTVIATAVAQPLPAARPAGWVYSEAGNLKLWEEGMATTVFTLDPQSGSVALTAVLSTPNTV